MTYTQKAKLAPNPAAQKLLLLMEEKQTNLAVAADVTTTARVLALADAAGPHIALLKTHIDVIEDFTPETVQGLRALAQKHHFMFFEDRKFADIGNTVKLQYTKGVYHIVEWADFVNAHIVPGPGIIEGLREAARESVPPMGEAHTKSGPERGLILLAQMSSKGSLATGAYTEKAVAFAKEYADFVVGYIANGGDPEELAALAKMAEPGQILFAPGVKLGGGGDALKQQYTTPEDVITAGADVIIVGRGVYGADNPAMEAQRYREAGWKAYKKRLQRVGGSLS